MTKSREITKLEDLKGLKLRVPPTNAYIEGYKALGAVPVPVNWNETYTSILQGVLDGCKNGYASMLSTKLYEVAPSLSNTNAFYSLVALQMNGKFHEELPADLKTVVASAIKKARGWGRTQAAEEDSWS